MRPFRFAILIAVLAMTGCGGDKDKSTDTSSLAFQTLAEKQEFLERYVSFRRSYDSLDFHIQYFDGETGMVPGPSEWDIRIVAVVPAEEIAQWTDGLSPTEEPDVTLGLQVPHAPSDLNGFTWFEDSGRKVGINSARRMVLYRSYAY